MPRASKLIPTTEGFDGTLGLVFDPTAPDEVRATIAVRDGLCNPFGIVHGGAYSGIAESIATASTIYRVHRTGQGAIGMGNDTRLLRPISEGAIHAQARTIHTGRTTWLWDVDFHDDDGRLCATSRVTVALRTYRPPPEA
ncbi:MAG TPA: PaaI family thioesterase [Conexibacter sp.]|nr:PaaI family thioesterase [Conexibacter sp.]